MWCWNRDILGDLVQYYDCWRLDSLDRPCNSSHAIGNARLLGPHFPLGMISTAFTRTIVMYHKNANLFMFQQIQRVKCLTNLSRSLGLSAYPCQTSVFNDVAESSVSYDIALIIEGKLRFHHDQIQDHSRHLLHDHVASDILVNLGTGKGMRVACSASNHYRKQYRVILKGLSQQFQ